MTREDLESFRGLMGTMLASYARLDELTEPTLPVIYPRKPGFRPQPADNPLGAWYWRTEIKGAPAGPLAGKTVAIKDNVCVAGVPMMNGCSVLEGYVPEIDATIVTRILAAGGHCQPRGVRDARIGDGAEHLSVRCHRAPRDERTLWDVGGVTGGDDARGPGRRGCDGAAGGGRLSAADLRCPSAGETGSCLSLSAANQQ
jgi:hypothetical protein